MRRTVSDKAALTAMVSVILVAGFIGLLSTRPVLRTALSAWKAVESSAVESALAQSPDDTAGVDDERSKSAQEDEKKTTGDKGVSIRIDESGIRIESPSGDADGDTSTHRIIVGSRARGGERYSEMGTDVVRFREDITVDAEDLVRGDVVVFWGDVTVRGKVVGDVVVFMGNARVLSGAEINGDLVVIGGTLDEESEVIIHGERVVLKSLDISLAGFPFEFGRHFRLLEFFLVPVKFFISLILSFLVILFLRDRVMRGHEHVATGVLKSFGTGFLVAFVGAFVIVFLTVILLITLIGIPLAFVLVVSCVAVFFVANTVFVYTLGSKVAEKLSFQTVNPFAIVLVGTAVLYLPALIGYGLSMMPLGGFLGGFFKILGWLFGVFAFLAGLGALFLSRFGARGVPVRGPIAGAAPPPVPGA